MFIIKLKGHNFEFKKFQLLSEAIRSGTMNYVELVFCV